MSNRELVTKAEISSLRGVNERMESTILQDDLVSNSRNIYFGIDGVATRIEGKILSGKFDESVVHMQQFGSQVLIQTLSDLRIVSVQELIELQFTYLPIIPDAPIFVSATTSTMTLTIPALPTHATSLDLLSSLNGTSFATLQVGVTSGSLLLTGLAVGTSYWFRVRAKNTVGYKDSLTLVTTTNDHTYLVSDTDSSFHIVSDQSLDPLYSDTDA